MNRSTREFQRAQSLLNPKFVYTSDRKSDTWNVLNIDEPVIRGDCEDYSLTLVHILSDYSYLKMFWNLLTMKFVLWYAFTPRGQGHVVLYARGVGWTDNIQKRIIKDMDALKDKGYKLWFPYIPPLIFIKWGVSKIL